MWPAPIDTSVAVVMPSTWDGVGFDSRPVVLPLPSSPPPSAPQQSITWLSISAQAPPMPSLTAVAPASGFVAPPSHPANSHVTTDGGVPLLPPPDPPPLPPEPPPPEPLLAQKFPPSCWVKRAGVWGVLRCQSRSSPSAENCPNFASHRQDPGWAVKLRLLPTFKVRLAAPPTPTPAFTVSPIPAVACANCFVVSVKCGLPNDTSGIKSIAGGKPTV